ncbi:hypothetical protein [Streptomyces sp. NPDC088350]
MATLHIGEVRDEGIVLRLRPSLRWIREHWPDQPLRHSSARL